MKPDAPATHFPTYIDGDPQKPLDALAPWYSKGALRRLSEQHGIKIAHAGTPGNQECWIKIGKQLFVVVKDYHEVARHAQVWWEYHYQLMPKVLNWQEPVIAAGGGGKAS